MLTPPPPYFFFCVPHRPPSEKGKRKQDPKSSSTSAGPPTTSKRQKSADADCNRQLMVTARYIQYPQPNVPLDLGHFLATKDLDISDIPDPQSRKSELKHSRRACACMLERCSEIRKRMTVHDSRYETLAILPPFSKLSTPNAELTNFIRRRWLCRLGRRDIGTDVKDVRVGLWHFHPLAVAKSMTSTVAFSKLVFDPEEAITMSIDKADLIRLKDCEYKNKYINTPMMSMTQMLEECSKLDDAKERLMGLASSASGLSSSFSSSSFSALASSRNMPPVRALADKFSVEDLQSTTMAEISALKREVEELKREKEELERLWAATPSGLTRANIVSDEFHAMNPRAAKHLFGFESWAETKAIVWAIWDDVNQNVTGKGHITKFEKILITKMRMRRSYDTESLAYIFDRVPSRITEYIQEWAPLWGQAGRDLSLLHITEEFLTFHYPQSYKDAGFVDSKKIGAVPDGKDIMMETHRLDSLFTRGMRSEKVHHSAARGVSWSLPAGLNVEHTALFLARATETAIVELWKSRLKKFPGGWGILADRGFARHQRIYPNWNRHYTPAFISGRKQFSYGELETDIRVCQLRYTSEVVYSRVTDETCLTDTVRRGLWPIMDAAWDWGHANGNLLRTLQK